MSLMFIDNITSISVYEDTDRRNIVGWIYRPGSYRAPNSSTFVFRSDNKNTQDMELVYCSTLEEAKQAALAHYVAMRMTQ